VTLRWGTVDNRLVDEFSAAGTSKQRYIRACAGVCGEGSFPLSHINGSLIAVPSIHPSIRPSVRLSDPWLPPSSSFHLDDSRDRKGKGERECNRCQPPWSVHQSSTGVVLLWAPGPRKLFIAGSQRVRSDRAKRDESEQSKGIIQEAVTLFPARPPVSHGTAQRRVMLPGR